MFTNFKRRVRSVGMMKSHSNNLGVHHLTNDPTAAWEELKSEQVVKIVEPLHLKSPTKENHVRFVCISDTHTKMKSMSIPPGDVLIHAGDFTNFGSHGEISTFNNLLSSLPHKRKIVISGNHEFGLDKQRCTGSKKTPHELLSNCTYLQDDYVIINGLKIYGTPWQPRFCDGAFQLNRGTECMSKWKKIPTDADVLISHTPPVGHGDLSRRGTRAGCVELLYEVQSRIKPILHVFGHIHEGYGMTSDNVTTFVNASACDSHYQLCNPPIIFDIPSKKTKK